MNLDQYMAAQKQSHRSTLPEIAAQSPDASRSRQSRDLIDTPVAVRGAGGKLEFHSLNRILYGSPPKESPRKLVRRMADLIVCCVTSSGGITREQLLGNFDATEIDQHFTAARKLTGLHRLGGTL